MTDEEIEERKMSLRVTVTASEVLSRYGVTVRWNRCRGWCHGGKDLNMKVFRDGCHCFVCGRSFDIFDITMHFNGCDFWTAFELLGGTQRLSLRAVVAAKNYKREETIRIQRETEFNKKLQSTRFQMWVLRDMFHHCEPMSDLWCFVYNKLQYQEYIYDELTGGTECLISKN